MEDSIPASKLETNRMNTSGTRRVVSEANDASKLKTNEDRVDKRIIQDEWKNGLEFGCFATMLRMFLVIGFLHFAYPISKTILEPVSTSSSRSG